MTDNLNIFRNTKQLSEINKENIEVYFDGEIQNNQETDDAPKRVLKQQKQKPEIFCKEKYESYGESQEGQKQQKRLKQRIFYKLQGGIPTKEVAYFEVFEYKTTEDTLKTESSISDIYKPDSSGRANVDIDNSTQQLGVRLYLNGNNFDNLTQNSYCTSLINYETSTYEFFEKELDKKEIFNSFLANRTQESNGEDLGLYDRISYSKILNNCQNAENIKLVEWYTNPTFKTNYNKENNKLSDTYFTRLNIIDKPEDQVNKLLEDLKLNKVPNTTKQNFAIVPFSCDGHISTLLIDLRNELPEGSKRILSFDSSTAHYEHKKPRQDIFGMLSDSIEPLGNLVNLQLTGCCGYWTSNFVEECSKMQNIEKIKKQCQTGDMQLKVACKVSEDIDLKTSGIKIQAIKCFDGELSDEEKNNYKKTIKIQSKIYKIHKDCENSTCINLQQLATLSIANEKTIDTIKNYLDNKGGLQKEKKYNKYQIEIETNVEKLKEDFKKLKELIDNFKYSKPLQEFINEKSLKDLKMLYPQVMLRPKDISNKTIVN